MEELLKERYKLARERLKEIPEEAKAPKPWRDYFQRTALFLQQTVEIFERKEEDRPLSAWEEENHRLYEDILPEHYEVSYGNPAYAARELQAYGPALSALYTELRGAIPFAYEKRLWDMTVLLELFLEVYAAFTREELPPASAVREIYYWYAQDYCADMVRRRIQETVDPALAFAADIVRRADLSDLRYLYRYGEYVTENEKKTAAFLNTFSQEEIDAMARTYTEGYRLGFIHGRKDLSKKKTVNIRYRLGFERMVRAAVEQFRAMGLTPTIYRAAAHGVNKRQQGRIGYYGGVPNPQFDYDHRQDDALFLDKDFLQRKLRGMQQAYEDVKELAGEHAGPAVIDIFGEEPFTPQACPDALALTEEQQKLQVELSNESSQITNRYIKGEERSFTIIAYPSPAIGDRFPEIFRDTVRINTLDGKKYEGIQQKIIETLDTSQWVQIVGRNGNETDLLIHLHELEDRRTQTNFENCTADVNIPVGEVFTSPSLPGTAGVLHVRRVYLEELLYKELRLTFDGGQIIDYSCANFESEEENRKYIEENLLQHHDTLPMGEFAIGTNTTAYVMAKKYDIAQKLPILIAEKMGPHFAVGDTCYSWAEDLPVYNPDGREVIARDNEISILRKEDKSLAYFGCHTDITIPYEELGVLQVLDEDGEGTPIIENGRFVLPGTEELNAPFKELQKKQEK